jgi:hypothetical protein
MEQPLISKMLDHAIEAIHSDDVTESARRIINTEYANVDDKIRDLFAYSQELCSMFITKYLCANYTDEQIEQLQNDVEEYMGYQLSDEIEQFLLAGGE